MIVILSTLNGETRLRAMLEALLRVQFPPGARLHAVDNASEDGTLALLESYTSRLPLEVHSQPIRGKNNCLNMILDRVCDALDPDELVVLTDDDILPSPEWLLELDAAGRAHLGCDVFAGTILPHWPNQRTAHLEPVRRHFGVLFSLTSASEGPIDCRFAWGPNMAVCARVFKQGFRFDPRFGPNGHAAYAMGSETELMERLEASGHRAWFAERACVRHIIRANQLEGVNVVQRAFRHGFGVGWRLQRSRGFSRFISLQLNALRCFLSARIRGAISARSHLLLAEFDEAWAQGFSKGAMFEFRSALATGRREATSESDNAHLEDAAAPLIQAAD